MTTKKMTIREFVDNGYLQELNRLYLHPLGLALAFEVPDATDEDPARVTTTACVIDSRDDPEGMIFSDGMIDLQKVQRVQHELRARRASRRKALGYVVQPPEKVAENVRLAQQQHQPMLIAEAKARVAERFAEARAAALGPKDPAA